MAGLGPFGPGRFCGIVRRPVFERVPRTRRRRVVRRVARRVCHFPSELYVALDVRYAAR